MKPMEVFRLALAEIGDASPAELSDQLKNKHGVKIEPAYIPLYKATLQDLDRTARVRQDEKLTPSKQPTQAVGIKELA